MAFDPRTKEERKLFPFWTLIVIAGCAALWVFGAKIYQESMAAYQSYAAITQNVAQNTYYLLKYDKPILHHNYYNKQECENNSTSQL